MTRRSLVRALAAAAVTAVALGASAAPRHAAQQATLVVYKSPT